uniref:Trehalase n=1 Tax=Saccoglossus kowalevskii TaxID=10224 RepID=A0ABM0MNJ2_SACKO|nr:PREDICTED: trehalase-like [Saccoglossus kowalevskii]
MYFGYTIVVVLCAFSLHVNSEPALQDMPPCFGWPQEEIYCYGDLLHSAQVAELYNDSKHYVDMNINEEPDVVLDAYEQLDDPTDEETMAGFIDYYYEGPGEEFEDWIPDDWTKDDAEYRAWATELQEIWIHLGRKIKEDVKDNQDMYSLIYVDQPFIVPGGRFREFYYWDSYWVINGLLISEMPETVKGMLTNFLTMVDESGFVPNGGRIYFSRRSQPPLLIPMFARYYNVTGDSQFVEDNLDILEMEYNFWMTNRTIDLMQHTFNHYAVDMGMPRNKQRGGGISIAIKQHLKKGITIEDTPFEDMLWCRMKKNLRRPELYSNLASACESGWDFSSRWLTEGRTSLDTIRTKEIIPVDLNSILCMSERIMAEFYERQGNISKSEEYRTAYEKRRYAINTVLFDPSIGAWFDYDVENGKLLDDEYYLSSVAPVWAGCYDDSDENRIKSLMKYFEREGALGYNCGVPTSMRESGQQWDFPNAWPPLQEMLITGLADSSLDGAHDLAQRLANNWVYCNWKSWSDTGHMFEKYDVIKGTPGGGGEYDVQLGFGWTNGVVIQMLKRYGDVLTREYVDVSSTVPMVTDISLTLFLVIHAVAAIATTVLL